MAEATTLRPTSFCCGVAFNGQIGHKGHTIAELRGPRHKVNILV
jgi:hypothetical protein